MEQYDDLRPGVMYFEQLSIFADHLCGYGAELWNCFPPYQIELIVSVDNLYPKIEFYLDSIQW